MADEPEQELDPQTRLARALFDDPETRPLIEDAIAKKFPKAVIPGRQARLETEQSLQAIRQEREAFKTDIENERRTRALESERDKARKLGISDEELPKVEELMKTRLIGNHEDAARLYRQDTETVAAPRSIYSTMDVPGLRGNHGEEFKGVNGGPSIIADRDTWARQMTDQILNDFKKDPQGASRRWS